MAAIRYRFHGRFISAAKAKRLGNFKNLQSHIRTESLKRGTIKTAKSVKGFKETPAEVKAAKAPKPGVGGKRLAAPPPKPPEWARRPVPAPPSKTKPPAAPPVASRPRKPRITPEERFENAANELEAMLEDAGPTPAEEELEDLSEQWSRVRDLYDALDDPSDQASAHYDEVGASWSMVTGVPMDAEDWDRELDGFDMIPGESEWLDEWEDYFDVLDVDEDKYKGKG